MSNNVEKMYQAAQMLSYMRPMIQDAADVCGGNSDARTRVEGVFPSFREAGAEKMVAAIEQIWAEERDEEKLTSHLGYEEGLIIHAILGLLRGEDPFPPDQTSEVSETSEVQEPEPQAPDGQQMVNLEDLIKIVVLAAETGIPPELKTEIQNITQAMSHDDRPEIRALGQVLNDIMDGNQDIDLSLLPPELAQMIADLMG
jgi:hypothetical protein